MEYEEIIRKLESLSDKHNVEGMERFGIITKARKLGVSNPVTRDMAKEIGTDHALAAKLWKSNIHEAQRLAALVDDPALVTEQQMEDWIMDVDNWGTCDTVCSNLFDKTPYAWKKAVEWTTRKEEFVKRAGFVMMAVLAVHDEAAKDDQFLLFLPIIKREATDERNFVKKAVNWALRQIGKRNVLLNKAAVATAREIQMLDSPAASWIAADALRELMSSTVQMRLKPVEKPKTKKTNKYKP